MKNILVILAVLGSLASQAQLRPGIVPFKISSFDTYSGSIDSLWFSAVDDDPLVNVKVRGYLLGGSQGAWDGGFAGTTTSGTTLSMSTTNQVQVFTGGSTATWTLPALGTPKAIYIKNNGTANLTVQRAGSDQIWTGAAVNSITLVPGESVALISVAGYWSALFQSAGVVAQLAAITFNENDFPVYVGETLTNKNPTEVKTILNLDNVPNLTAQQIVDDADVNGTNILDGTIPWEKLEQTLDVDLRDDPTWGLAMLGMRAGVEAYGLEYGNINTAQTLVDNQERYTYIVSRVQRTITGVTFYQVTQGVYTADGENRIGLYAVDTTTGTGTLVASTANDGNLWKAATGLVEIAFSATYSMPAGVPHYIGFTYNNSAETTAPTISGGLNTHSSLVPTTSRSYRLTGAKAGRTTLVATEDMSSTNVLNLSSRSWFMLW